MQPEALLQDEDIHSALLLLADEYEERDDLRCYEVRSIACLVEQVLQVLNGVELRQTGSRLYGWGTYATNKSDWDFYCQADEYEIARLKGLGWQEPARNPVAGPTQGSECKDGVSLYMGRFNLLVATTDEAYEALEIATAMCLAMQPTTRQQAVESWIAVRVELGLG